MLRVLNGHGLETKALLYPESMGLNLTERDSTATPTAGTGPEVPKLKTGDWVQDMDEPGAGIVWRVRTEDTQYNTETITYTLEHMINSLADRILPDEVKADDMGGSGGSCTAKQAAQYILGQQSDWVLGDFEFNVSNPYRFSGETLKAALETVTNSLEDPVWEYDFTVYPFRLHVRQLSDTVDSELREDRNLTTLKYTVDRTRMYTRFYPVGKNNLKPDGKYVSRNEDVYGRVDKTETDQSKDTQEKLVAWANERLDRHAEPLVTVTISGLDLSAGTGEPLDKMTVCHKCRVPLPAYSTTIIEKVTKLSWRDKIKGKESVTVTLANALADIQSIIKEEKSRSSGRGRTAAEMNYGIETTIGNVESGLYTRITQTAYEIRQEAHDESRSLRSIISQTAESIRLIVENDVGSLRSQIIQTAESIRLEVSNEAASLRSSITQTAESIRMEVANEASSLRSSIIQTAESIRLEVSNEAASLRSSITQTAESIRMEVANEASSLRSSITQTAESLRITFENEITSTRSEFQQTADMVGMIVEGTGSNAHIKPAKIQASINAATGDSKITLSADNVEIDGDVVTGALEGEDVVCDSLEAGGLTIGGECEFDINSPIIGGNGGSNEYNWGDVIVCAELLSDNKTLRLYSLDGECLDFSKAVTLSEAWSNGDFPLTINATQTNGGVTTNVGAKSIGFTNASDIYVTVEKNGTPSAFGSSKKLINVPFKIVHHAGGQVGDQDRYSSSLASVDASSVYDNGWDDVVLSDPDWQYPAANHNSDNTTAANSVIVAASAKKDGTTRQKTIPIALTVDTANKIAKVSAGGYIRAQAAIDMKTNAEYNTAVANAGYAGRAAVTISNTLSWGTSPSSDISVSQNSFTVSTAGRTDSSGTIQQDTETFNLYSQVSTNGLDATFTVTIGDSQDGSRIIKRTVTCTVPSTYILKTSVTAGISDISWDSTNKYFYGYGYAYAGSSSPQDTTSKKTSSQLSIGDNSWSNGTKKVWVKHGSSEILSDTVSIPAVSDTTWENTSGNYWRTRLTIGGVYRYSSTKEFATAGYTQEQYDQNFLDGYNYSDHDLGIYDVNSTQKTSVYVSAGGSLELWPGFPKYQASGYVWGTKVTVHGSYPSNHCILKYMSEYTTENNGTYTYWFRYQNRTGSPPFTGEKTVYWN